MPDQRMLEKYATVAIDVGIGVESGDRVLISSPVQLPEFTRLLVEIAYERGAESVDVLWQDDIVSRARYAHGSEDAASVVSGMSRFLMEAHAAGSSFLRVYAEDPSALAGVDLDRVQTHQRVNGEFTKPFWDAMGSMAIPWTVISAPVPAWNRTVLPDEDDVTASEKMWSAIFRACRIDSDDPVAAWQGHLAELGARKDHLTSRRYSGLRYEGPGTDLAVGLTDRATWEGGGVKTMSGRPFAPNIPTEEVFTSPHRLRASGTIRASKPLSYFGTLIEGFSLELSDGEVTRATAEGGHEALDRILATDDGSSRFGELAMVPISGAVAAEGLVWNNRLYDENDACHIALGQSYPTCYEGAPEMTVEQRKDVGLNESTVHVDFVVGSTDLRVFGILPDGSEEVIIQDGEWGFSV